jgi:hypothetical protein
MCRVSDEPHRGQRIVTKAPGDVAAPPADRIEQLPIAFSRTGKTVDGDRPEVIDGHRRFTRERLHGAT